MTIGLISDTHNFLDPRVEQLFQGVGHILHAGDVGMPWLLLQLERIAPVTGVLGNTDTGLHLRETEVCSLGNRVFMVHHIVNPHALPDTLRSRICKAKPQVVVFGHTHKAFDQEIGGIRYINPGYAGRPKLGQARSAALLHLDHGSIHLEVLPL